MYFTFDLCSKPFRVDYKTKKFKQFEHSAILSMQIDRCSKPAHTIAASRTLEAILLETMQVYLKHKSI